MLQSISDGVRNSRWLGWLIVGIISVPFALWGIGSYFGVGEEPYVAKVNGVEISAREYERAYYQQRNRMARQFGGRLPAALAEAGFVKTQTVDSLVTQQLLLQTVSGAGYRVADTSLRDSIVEDPQFQIDGNFSKDAYDRQLRSLGVGPDQYEANLRQALALEQMRSGVIATAFYTEQELADIAQLRAQTRTAQSLSFEVDAFKTDDEVSDEQLQEYFEANGGQFFHPETVKLEYLELDQATIARDTEVAEDDLQALYEEQRAAYTTPEKRYARHILIRTESDADEQTLADKQQEIDTLRERLVAGESFEDLAREHSQDPGSAPQGGDLGHVQRGIMVKPFEDALFELQEGELSEVVKTAFGYHIIKLDRLEGGAIQAFEEVREKILEQEQLRLAENVFYDRVDVIQNETYTSNDSLIPASEASGIAVATSDWIQRGEGAGIGEHAAVRAAAFSDTVLDQRLNSEMIEIGNNHVLVIRVSEHQDRRAKTLDEVRDEVREAIRAQRARDAAESAAEEALAALRNGESAADVAERLGGTLQAHDEVSRNDAGLDANVRRELFRLPRPQAGASYTSLTNTAGDSVVLVLESVQGAPASEEEDAEPVRSSPGNNEYNAWLEALKSVAEIEKREENL